MRLYICIVLPILLGLCCGIAQGDGGDKKGGGKRREKEFGRSGVFVKVLGQSGKILVARGKDVEADSRRVVVEMDGLIERDADEKAIKAGKVKHSFKSFASQDFTFSDLKEGELQGISHTYFTFESQLKDLTSTLKVTVMIIKENGTITFDDEDQEVRPGTVKFNIELNNWTFCDASCKPGDREGKFVDFVITIKGKDGKAREQNRETKDGGRRRAKAVELGGGAILTLSNKVKAGDAWTTMADGYPKAEEQGAKTKYTFRFTNSADNTDKYFFYDPSIGYNDHNSGQISSFHVHVGLMCWFLVTLLVQE